MTYPHQGSQAELVARLSDNVGRTASQEDEERHPQLHRVYVI